MKLSRWIYVPLLFAIGFAIIYSLFGFVDTFNGVLGLFVSGAFVGFVVQLWSDLKAKNMSKRNDEEIYKVRQNRTVTLLSSYEKAFALCKDAINSLNRAKIKTEDLDNGIVKIKTGISWDSFGQIITLNLRKINENLTEVEISTQPIPGTALVDYGEGWKYAENISRFLKEKDAEINKKVLVDSAEILDKVYVKPFQKEKVQR